jgi:hypothetical protein
LKRTNGLRDRTNFAGAYLLGLFVHGAMHDTVRAAADRVESLVFKHLSEYHGTRMVNNGRNKPAEDYKI